MNGIDILEKFAAYEVGHDVENYEADGWHVWPFIRVMLGLKMLPSVGPSSCAERGNGNFFGGSARSSVRQLLSYAKARLKVGLDGNRGWCPDGMPTAALFLTLSERRVRWRDKYYEIYSDPFVELFEKLGMQTMVWETGATRFPQYSESEKISGRLDAETRCVSVFPRRLNEPSWFAELDPLLNAIVGRRVFWHEIADAITVVTNRAVVFERWLKQVKPSVLFFICWYSPVVMSATMAARRCGIKTVEIQHGVQGKGHFAYAAWQRAPQSGYEVVPDVFWTWGETAAQELVSHNPAFFGASTATAGGNLWLNKWRTEASKSPNTEDGGRDRRILVSLQWDVSDALLDAIRVSPPGWLWQIRFHPSRGTAERTSDMRRFAETGHAGIEFEKANAFLLYELLGNCDVHLTGSSTCALEALAFGVPSIILGDTELGCVGKVYYRQFLDEGVMQLAETSGQLLAYVAEARRLDMRRSAISSLYADPEAASRAVRILLQ